MQDALQHLMNQDSILEHRDLLDFFNDISQNRLTPALSWNIETFCCHCLWRLAEGDNPLFRENAKANYYGNSHHQVTYTSLVRNLRRPSSQMYVVHRSPFMESKTTNSLKKLLFCFLQSLFMKSSPVKTPEQIIPTSSWKTALGSAILRQEIQLWYFGRL